jgi:molybdenum cofactor guanylyltransferase
VAERAAGIVLAGGQSTRMGTAKAMLEWHGSTLVRRVAGLVARAIDGPVVVVRAAGQDLPALPSPVEIAEDARDGRGPLQGIAAGLDRLSARADVIFVTGVDTPLLHPAFVAHVLRSLRPEDDAALPRAHGFGHHLAAAYRTTPLARILGEQIERERLGARELVARLHAQELDEAALLADPQIAALDPHLDSLLNLNTPAEYEAARARQAPRIAVRTAANGAWSTVHAATLAGAAQVAGITRVSATLEGHGPVSDPGEPLAIGDALTFATS